MEISTEIRNKIKKRIKCRACFLYGNENVISFGPRNCDILFIGLNPGKTEIVEDKPFVGKAGQILHACIEHAELVNVKIAYTNAILCSTEKESDIPSVSDCISLCKNLVYQIIGYHNPKVIVTLGSGAKQLFSLKGKISEIHGNLFKIENFTVMPLFHPSSLRYGSQSKMDFIKELTSLKSLIQGN